MTAERITALTLEGAEPRTPEIEHERGVALADLLAENEFSVSACPCGPYSVVLKNEEGRLVFDVTGEAGQTHKISLAPQGLKRVVRDYFLICDSYYMALKEAKSHKLEAIDMGRRGVHNEGAEQLKAMLERDITMDFATARRLFTLVCVLHLK